MGNFQLFSEFENNRYQTCFLSLIHLNPSHCFDDTPFYLFYFQIFDVFFEKSLWRLLLQQTCAHNSWTIPGRDSGNDFLLFNNDNVNIQISLNININVNVVHSW